MVVLAYVLNPPKQHLETLGWILFSYMILKTTTKHLLLLQEFLTGLLRPILFRMSDKSIK